MVKGRGVGENGMRELVGDRGERVIVVSGHYLPLVIRMASGGRGDYLLQRSRGGDGLLLTRRRARAGMRLLKNSRK